ncbi:hypothetical protein BKI52_22925 [marine bacterium AO1-C]|nr:hypothetical protein BKI52_22925 [marine bacterium AO1-C]
MTDITKTTFLFTICIITFFSCQQVSTHTQAIETKKSSALQNIKNKPYTLNKSSVHHLISSINHKKYDIYVKLPPSYKKTEKAYPILVLTDAGYAFPLVASISRRLFFAKRLEEFIIVGISYAKGEHFGISRTRDYTPTYSPNETLGYSKAARSASGQADKFIEFIKKDLFTFLDKTYRVDLNKKVFAGHSLGGLLANYMVVSAPETFEYYLSGSPSLWYHNQSIFTIEEKYAQQHKNLSANLYMCIGDKEDNQGPYKMVSQMFEFHKKLLSRSYKNLRVEALSLPGEDHETMYPSFITKGILWAFKTE